MSRRPKLAFDKYRREDSWRAAAPTRRPKGQARARNVVIEFASLQAAQDCYHSPEYQAARAIRQKYADGEMVLVEGVP